MRRLHKQQPYCSHADRRGTTYVREIKVLQLRSFPNIPLPTSGRQEICGKKGFNITSRNFSETSIMSQQTTVSLLRFYATKLDPAIRSAHCSKNLVDTDIAAISPQQLTINLRTELNAS